jgi:hypothetical protein
VGGFTYYLKFSNTNRVTMVSDFLLDIAAFPKESGYRLKALQRPSLIFDTYSYMHIPADPDPNVSFSPTGSGGYGYGTDFNFSFTEVTPKDTMVLEGNFNKSSAVLIKATQAEMDAALTNQQLAQIIYITANFFIPTNPYLYFPATPGLKIATSFDFNKTLITFSYEDGGVLINKVVGFSFTTYGLHLQNPVTLGSYTFQDIYFDDTTGVYYILSGTTRVEFANNPTPVISLSLTNIIGNQLTTITIPPGANLPGESSLFISNYNAVKDAILSGIYGLDLGDMNFVFNAGSQTMDVIVYVFQNGAGPFICRYSYTYLADANGNFKFTKIGQNGNGGLIVDDMNNILSYIEADQFTIDGFSTSAGLLGQMKSIENPLFYFSGNLY